MLSENSSLMTDKRIKNKTLRIGLLCCLGLFVLFFLAAIVGLIFIPITPAIRKWYDPIPEAINSIATEAKVVYPMIDEVVLVSKTVIRGDVLFQFGFSEFNKSFNFINLIIDKQIDPILELTNSTISGMTNFVNGIADFLHKFHINFNLTFVKNLNIMNELLQEVPSQLNEMQIQLDRAATAGAAVAQSVDVVGFRFDKFIGVCQNLSEVADDVFVNVDVVMKQLGELDNSIPPIVILFKIVGCFVLAWLVFISIILFLFVI